MYPMASTNEQGHIWIKEVNDYVCPSYLNKEKTGFSDKESEYIYKLHQKHYAKRIKRQVLF